MTVNKSKIRQEYLLKLFSPYKKKGEIKFFIFQYLRGAGKELNKKFWSPVSSSRLAFNLYSWLAKNDSPVVDFEFEYQLPGLKSGGMGPNMDVYIETKDEIIFIESKFTEKADLNYINLEDEPSSYLSPAYYAPSHGKKGMELKDRFYEYPFAEEFSKFCYSWEKTMRSHLDWREHVDWFEPKQETCHLSGILLFLFDPKNKALIKGKKIRLYNIYWHMKDDESRTKSDFCQMAQSMIDRVIDPAELGIKDFQIGAFSIQDMLDGKEKLSEHIVFPLDIKKGVEDYVLQSGIDGKKRGQKM